ncbi:MAG: hypothetical protein D6734_07725 [Candidatus Schekmanbacteria bacterium]|nr:MAG: hypothetical protein D6734_07725 [Candidatus Schekmanbacteria bacterium]
MTLLSSYDTPGDVYDILVKNDIAYVCDGSEGLQIIDVSNPVSPTLLATYENNSDIYNGKTLDVAISGTVAYIAEQIGGLQIVDVSNPSSPTNIGSFDIWKSLGNQAQSTGPEASSIEVAGKYAYVALMGEFNEPNLAIIDISNPSSPQLVGSIDTTPSLNDFSLDMFLITDTVYLADDERGMQIVDVSNPVSPTLVATYDTVSNPARDVVVSGNYAYLADWGAGLIIIDVTDISNPVIRRSYHFQAGYYYGLFLNSDEAYIAGGDDGFFILDVSKPATSNPSLVGSVYDTAGSAQDVFVSGELIFIAEGKTGIEILKREMASNEKLPDLIVKSLKIAKSFKRGKKAKIKAIVKNIGNANSNNSKISFYLSKNKKKIFEGDTLIRKSRIKALVRGKKNAVLFRWKVPQRQRRGKYYIKAFCDSSKQVEESDDTNNIKVSKKVKVK